MALSDLAKLVDPRMAMPILGKVYRPPILTGFLGLWLRQSQGLAALAMADAEPEAMQQAFERMPDLPDDLARLSMPELLLGHAYHEMIADRVPDAYIWIATKTVMLSALNGDEAAEAYWNSGGDPKALLPNRADRRTATRSTAGANVTQSPASTSGTNSRRKNRRKNKRSRSSGLASSGESTWSSPTFDLSTESTSTESISAGSSGPTCTP